MKVKIFSVREDDRGRADLPHEEGRYTKSNVSADAYLEQLIQEFLDQHAAVQIRHLQFSTVSKTPSEDALKHGFWRPVEKSVLIFYDDHAG